MRVTFLWLFCISVVKSNAWRGRQTRSCSPYVWAERGRIRVLANVQAQRCILIGRVLTPICNLSAQWGGELISRVGDSNPASAPAPLNASSGGDGCRVSVG